MSQKPDETIKVFMGLGLSEQKAKETLKNQSLCDNLLGILRKLGHVDVPQTTGTLLYHLASKCKPQVVAHLPMISQYIFEKKLDTTVRVEKALEFVANHLNNSVNPKELEEYCGVGVVVTPEEIEKTVEGILNQHKAGLLKDRYKFNTGPLMQQVRKLLPWADGKAVKSEVDIQVLTLLGPKTEQDLAPVKKKTSKVATSKEEEPQLTIADVMRKVNFHAPGDNYKTDGYISTEHTYKLLKEHLKTTGGKVRTRFPPEPNGILHIGHAKAININFGYAAVNNGVCFLRYDDTNPEKEEEKFFTGIRDIVEWLGYTPYKITHSSDYFNQLYLWAVQLIKEGLAYVCHQKAEEMKGFNPEPSKWRDRPIEESLQLFEDMKNGKIDEGQATLRLKITLEEGKLDPVAYRVRFTPHHRTGNQWCIYPTYDYTHCLCDSIENITHSLCTKEFQSRRSSYYWLCNALNIYCPVQWEYGRLNVNYTVVSKRKIAKLITEGIVKDWDDPRLFTLTALRRRGFPAEAINKFCAQLGVTGAQSTVDPSMLEAFIRDHLNVSAQRRMVVLNPLKVVIENYPHPGPITVAVPNFPQNPELGSHLVTFDKVIYIDRSDYLPEDTTKTYKRLTNNQIVGLRHAGVSLRLLLADVNNKTNQLERLVCAMEPLLKDGAKPKGYIHWVSDPHEVEVRQYSTLFKHKNPEDPSEVPGGFLTDCNLDSLKIVQGFADKTILTAKAFEKYQFERDGFYSVDPDSKGDKLVFNLTVGLKEDAGK